jgi:hypothetical protein
VLVGGWAEVDDVVREGIGVGGELVEADLAPWPPLTIGLEPITDDERDRRVSGGVLPVRGAVDFGPFVDGHGGSLGLVRVVNDGATGTPQNVVAGSPLYPRRMPMPAPTMAQVTTRADQRTC